MVVLQSAVEFSECSFGNGSILNENLIVKAQKKKKKKCVWIWQPNKLFILT